MVKCDAKYCEIEWFHTECVEEGAAQNNGKWFCKDCREVQQQKDRQKKKKPKKERPQHRKRRESDEVSSEWKHE